MLDRPTPKGRPTDQCLAGAPISWGACEVPGWGPMPSAERVLTEMAQLGLRGTELGPEGFLPRDPGSLSALLKRFGLELVGGFLPLVLHEPRIDGALSLARDTADSLAQAGGRMLVVALVQDMAWTPPAPLDDEGWRRLADHMRELQSVVSECGVTVALHPHVGTLVQEAEEVARALDTLDVSWCLDTGHLFIGGMDPAQFARAYGDRVVHVHLKDVDAEVAARLGPDGLSLLEATREGLFLPLGEGDARIREVLLGLEAHEYDGWLVLEQDTAVTGDEPTVGSGAMRDARASIAFLHDTARTTQEVHS
jgi:inosose dehydratase